MLGQPVSMLIPRVVGFKLDGQLPDGSTATDLVLTITEMLRRHGVVGKFVEFYGPGVGAVPLANRATIGNMSPEYGSTCAIFPIDDETLRYLRFTGRKDDQIALVEAYAKENGLWHDGGQEPSYSETLELDLSTVEPSLAGPKRPQDRVPLESAKPMFREALDNYADSVQDSVDEANDESFPASDPAQPTGDAEPMPHSAADRRRRPDHQPDPGDHGRRHPVRTGPRRGRDRRDHLVHQHLEPVGDDRRGPAGQERGREGPDPQAVGQDHPGAGLEGRHRLLRARRPHPLPRQARLQSRRLRLHHLHRQLRTAAGGGLAGGQRRRPGGGQRAVGQPELRGPDQPRRQDELPRLAAAGRGLRPGRLDGHRHHHRTARSGRRRPRRPPRGHLALPRRGPAGDRRGHRLGDVHQGLRRRLRRRPALAGAADARGRHLRVGRRVDLRPQAPVLRGHGPRARPGHRHRGRPGARQARRLGHHRPHQPGRAPSRPTPRPASTWPSTASSAATSTPTAPAAATTR